MLTIRRTVAGGAERPVVTLVAATQAVEVTVELVGAVDQVNDHARS